MTADRVLVTGGRGVIGSWVCRELVRRGVEPVVLDPRPVPAVAFPETSGLTAGGDLRDPHSVRAVVEDRGITRLIHLAAIVGERAERDPALALEVNAVASAHLLDIAAGAGIVRIVAMSTKGVLGPLDLRYLHPRYEPVPVNLPPSPRSVYEVSKYAVEVLVRLCRERGTPAAAMRLATTWGPGKTAETHGEFSLHAGILERALRGEGSRVDVHPAQAYDLIYYGDVARGLVAACLDGELRSPVYHLGSGRTVTMGEFATAVEGAVPGIRVELGRTFPRGRNCLLDVAPARADFGYEPAFDLVTALADARAVVDMIS